MLKHGHEWDFLHRISLPYPSIASKTTMRFSFPVWAFLEPNHWNPVMLFHNISQNLRAEAQDIFLHWLLSLHDPLSIQEIMEWYNTSVVITCNQGKQSFIRKSFCQPRWPPHNNAKLWSSPALIKERENMVCIGSVPLFCNVLNKNICCYMGLIG